MSYRDIRNFTEMLRALGYPQLISMESFRKPNFPLTANILVWLAKKFEPEVDLPLEIGNEEDRVLLIRNVAQFMADGYAIKEILKITTLLYEVLISNSGEKRDQDDDSELSIRDFDISDKMHDLKQSRQLASEITMSGANLFELLGKEINLKTARQGSMGRQYEVSDIESGVKRALEAIKAEIAETKELIENVSTTETSLDTKIERRKVEIDRYEKRLQTLKKPAFLEEFTALEVDLNKLFSQYSVRLRCLAQLERLAAEAERAHQQRQQMASSQKLVAEIPLDEPDNVIGLNESIVMPDQRALPSRQDRPRARTGGRARTENEVKVFGTMDPGITNSPPSVDVSSDSDSEDLFLDKDEPELGQSDDDSLGLELSTLEVNRRAPSGRITSSKVQDNSDDDF